VDGKLPTGKVWNTNAGMCVEWQVICS